MSRKLTGILIIFFGVLFLFVIVYAMFFNRFSIYDIVDRFTKKQAIQEEIKTSKPVASKNEPQHPKVIQPDVKRISIEENNFDSKNKKIEEKGKVEKVGKESLKRMAASFVERFGSYSNHSNFSNVADLKVFMSQSMGEWADKYVKEKREENEFSKIYYGITTKAIDEEIQEFNDDINQAVILVKTRRREASGSTNNASNVFNQSILISFVKERGSWKIDSANWQDK